MSPVRLFAIAVILGTFCWVCASLLFSNATFAFRDTEYFYLPLFEWTARQWQAGHIPLWNPLENCGTPLVADATSSVFYPFKVLLLLPLPFVWNFKLFVLGHLLLAAGGSYCVARRWGSDRFAATLAAISYAFGGNVLFQYCNVVYLVGAAWLPLAMMATDRMLKGRSWRAAVALSAVLAVMTLGGDPQAAYHVGLAAGIYALVLRRHDRRELSDEERLTGTKRWSHNRLTLLLVAGSLGFFLAAIQILPSMSWSQQSERAVFDLPRSIYEVPSYLRRPSHGPEDEHVGVSRALLGKPQAGTHHDHIYQFSVGPWRAIEFLWPNATGRMFPENQRWASVIPGEDRTWVPSMYMGLLPILLAALAWRLRGGDTRQRWLSWLCLLSAIGALGWYGVGWILIELRQQVTGVVPVGGIGEPVGGLYWLMVTFLPGYAYFRFPAKLMIVAVFAASQLAAIGWQQSKESEFVTLRRLSIVAAIVSAFVFAIMWTSDGWIRSKLTATPVDEVYGPLDTDGAIAGMHTSLLHGVAVAGMLVLVFGPLRRLTHRRRWLVSSIAVGLTAIEITLANRCLIATTDASYLSQPSSIIAVIEQDEASNDEAPSGRIFRAMEDQWVPDSWRKERAEQRIDQSARWRFATVYPKYNLLDDRGNIDVLSSITSVDYATFIEASRNFGVTREDGVFEPHPIALDMLGVDYIIGPPTFVYDDMESMQSRESQRFPESATLSKNPYAYPRAWIVNEVISRPAVTSRVPHDRFRAAMDTFFDGDSLRDFQRTAIVETDAAGEIFASVESPTNADPTCTVEYESPNEVHVSVDLEDPGFLVLSDFYADGWQAELLDRSGSYVNELTIHRTNRIMRGVTLPAGSHRVVFRYHPQSVVLGAIISGIAWALLAVGIVATWLRRRSGSRTSQI